jgi:sensor histidine kinase YesM
MQIVLCRISVLNFNRAGLTIPRTKPQKTKPNLESMIKDFLLKLIFIPLLGIVLPLTAGIISYAYYTTFELIAAHCFFILTSFVIWAGCLWLHSKLRVLYTEQHKPAYKLLSVCAVSALYAASIGGLSVIGWMNLSYETFSWTPIYNFVAVCVFVVILFTLAYEILFLNKERELDSKIVQIMDQERSQATLQALRSELDPHFIFNSLNTLNYLIAHDAPQALLFNNRLAQVYKYILVNRNKELVSLTDEIEFIDNYFFLLQIRHENKLAMVKDMQVDTDSFFIPPCALQLLVENSIKHNDFSQEHPLEINITISGLLLKVRNTSSPRKYKSYSTGVGLKNLRSRYRIICHKNIQVEQTSDHFIVTLPLITQNQIAC